MGSLGAGRTDDREGVVLPQSSSDGARDAHPPLPPRYTTREVAKHLRCGMDTLRKVLDELARQGVVFQLIGVGRAKLWTPEQVRQLEQEIACVSSLAQPPRRRGPSRRADKQNESAWRQAEKLLAKPKRPSA